MKIKLHEITVRDLTEGYADNGEGGVVGYGGRLDIRPPYQREFVYKDKQRDAVIDTLRRDYPLNVMYWAVLDDGRFEVIDGQQRSISVCQYVAGDYSIAGLAFHNLQDDQQNQILDYALSVYLCEGEDSEKLDWFRTINIAGEKLTDQELRNAVYAGPWTADAKRYFSRTGCPAYALASDYLTGAPIRQDYLETAIKWHAAKEGVATIEDYMSRHQHDPNAVALWNYFRSVIDWTKATFPTHRKEMKGLPWGPLYNRFGDQAFDPAKMEAGVAALLADPGVTNNKGVFEYLLGGSADKKLLAVRVFDDKTKRAAYERQTREAKDRGTSNCPLCALGDNANKTRIYEFAEMDADHVSAWSKGGDTSPENCEMLCTTHNRAKGNL